MTVAKENDEIVIRIAGDIDLKAIQTQLDYIRYWEIVSKSKATQEDVDELAEEVNRNWWEKNSATYFPNVK